MVKSDWGSGDAETVKASLLADIHGTKDQPNINKAVYSKTIVNPALRRLRLYFPEAYRALPGGELTRKAESERSR